MINILKQRTFLYYKLVTLCLIAIATVMGILSTSDLASAQFSLPSTTDSSSSSPLPQGVERYGSIEVAIVKSPIDGSQLFPVASSTILNRSNISENQLPVEIRAEQVTANLKRALYGKFQDLQSLEISIATLNNQPIIQVSDENITRPLRLVTVTELDADFEGKIPQELAQEWKTILEQELIKGIKLFSPQELSNRILKVVKIIGGAIFLSALLWLCQRLLQNQLKKLRAKQAQQSAENAAEIPVASTISPEETMALMRQRFLSQVKNQLSLQKQLGFYSFWRWLLFWSQIIVWYVSAIWICGTLPILMQYKTWVLAFPLDILFIWFFTSLAIRVSNGIIDRFFNAWKTHEFMPIGESQRKEMRTGTISQAVKGLVTFLLLFGAIAYVLDLFGISTSSIIAGGAVIGVAVSLGSQNVIKDLVNGVLVLAEDQYAVGDVVKIGGVGGLVENLNLRVTQIRNGEGSLVTIPNSSIVQVENLTRNWSRVNFTIEVAYSADIDLALELLHKTGEQMFNEPQWHNQILELPQVLGIDDLSHKGLLIRVWIRTQPLQQWSVGREFRYRVRMIFAENNIAIGKPQLVNYYSQYPFLDSSKSNPDELI